MIKGNSDLADSVHDFGLGMHVLSYVEVKRPVPAQRSGLAEWKVEIGDGVQDFCREALFPKCSFSRNAGECAERVMKMDCPYAVGFKAD